MSEEKARLIATWPVASTDHRLTAVAKYTRGYEDTYVIERKDQDILGGARWIEVARWGAGSHPIEGSVSCAIATALVAGIKAALAAPSSVRNGAT